MELQRQIAALILAGLTFLGFNRSNPPIVPVQDPDETAILPQSPIVASSSAKPSISASSYVVYDVDSSQVVTGLNQDLRLMPASTTKIMTAIIAKEAYAGNEVVTISRAVNAIGHTVDFVPGEKITVDSLLKSMMINSGNDAAMALAEHHPGGYQAFVDAMNRKSKHLGLKNTHFSNVSGVEADDHYSSARDLAIIAEFAMKNQDFREIVSTKTSVIYSVDKQVTHKLENLNQLLWDVPGVVGVKTGWTELAGDCLVTYIDRDHDLIFVVLKSRDRFADTRTLIDWSFRELIWD